MGPVGGRGGRRRAVGFGGVDAEGSVGAGEEKFGAVGFDGVDLCGAAGEELEGVVGAVDHCCPLR